LGTLTSEIKKEGKKWEIEKQTDKEGKKELTIYVTVLYTYTADCMGLSSEGIELFFKINYKTLWSYIIIIIINMFLKLTETGTNICPFITRDLC
jgi:hypothetical protein